MADGSSTVAHQGSVENGDTAGQLVEDRAASVARVLDNVEEGSGDAQVEDEDLAGPRQEQTEDWLAVTLASLPGRYQTPVAKPTEHPDGLLRDLERML